MSELATKALQRGYAPTVDYLKSLEESGRIHHAYLVIGAHEGAQNYLAEHWAKRLVGVEGPTVHPDLFMVRANAEDEHITVATAREIRNHLVRSPMRADRRVVVIENVDRSTDQAANALLKILEEPRADSVTLLTTSSPDALPATLRSRLHRLFAPVIPSSMSRELIRALGTSLSEAEVEQYVHLSNGRFQRLVSLLETDDEQHALLVQASFWLDFFEADVGVRESMVQERFATKSKKTEALHMLGEYLETAEALMHDVFLMSARSSHSVVFQSFASRLEVLAEQWGKRGVTIRLAVLGRLRTMYERKVNKKMLLDYLIIRL